MAFGLPPGTIHGGVFTDILIMGSPIIHGTTDGIVLGIQAGTTPGTMYMDGMIPGTTTDTADMTGTTIHIIITDTIPAPGAPIITIRMLPTANVLLQTDNITALHQVQEDPPAPHIQGGARAEVPIIIIQAASIQARAPVEHRQEAAAEQSTDAVPAVPRAIRAALLPVVYAQHAEAAVLRAIIPAPAAEVLQAATTPAPAAGALQAATAVAAGVLQAAIAVVADIAAVAAPVAAVVVEEPVVGDNSTIII